jgi:hypothetical protein
MGEPVRHEQELLHGPTPKSDDHFQALKSLFALNLISWPAEVDCNSASLIVPK